MPHQQQQQQQLPPLLLLPPLSCKLSPCVASPCAIQEMTTATALAQAKVNLRTPGRLRIAGLPAFSLQPSASRLLLAACCQLLVIC